LPENSIPETHKKTAGYRRRQQTFAARIFRLKEMRKSELSVLCFGKVVRIHAFPEK